MPNPLFTKPWHGIPRDQIHWNPSVLESVCIGCGTCVTGCSRLVYRFDFDRKKSVVIDPLNCMVGCTTCANTCPTHAIEFPPLETVLALEGEATVRHAVEDDLLARRAVLATQGVFPHPDRIVNLTVARVEHVARDVVKLTLSPLTPGECFCEFSPGQYIELWQPESTQMSRAYSIANAPHGDGSIELHIRRVEGGRFSAWAFDSARVGDRLQARGPLGNFTISSTPEKPLLFVAGGTGLAPILALLEQQVRFAPERDMVVVWGARHAEDFYALDTLQSRMAVAPNLRVWLAAESGELDVVHDQRLTIMRGTAASVLTDAPELLANRDVYAAGPPVMLRHLAQSLKAHGIDRSRIHMDQFGT